MIQIREEPVPKCKYPPKRRLTLSHFVVSKKLARTFTQVKFVKEKSVFKLWKEDTAETAKNCLRHDFKYWKCTKFLKDPEEYKDVTEVIKKHFSSLKEIFLQFVAKGGDPPDIKQLDFLEFCQSSGITDDIITASILDIYFTATNFEESDQGGNDDRALIRFEFLEILVRIVRGKYIETKKMNSLGRGLEKLIVEHVILVKDVHYTWQKFREDHLWTFHVNELFEANYHLLE